MALTYTSHGWAICWAEILGRKAGPKYWAEMAITYAGATEDLSRLHVGDAKLRLPSFCGVSAHVLVYHSAAENSPWRMIQYE